MSDSWLLPMMGAGNDVQVYTTHAGKEFHVAAEKTCGVQIRSQTLFKDLLLVVNQRN